MKAIIKVYVKLIQNGMKTLEDVPESDREDVVKALAEITSNQ
jgi:hypothetical protein